MTQRCNYDTIQRFGRGEIIYVLQIYNIKLEFWVTAGLRPAALNILCSIY